jgi:hypothetical protein
MKKKHDLLEHMNFILMLNLILPPKLFFLNLDHMLYTKMMMKMMMVIIIVITTKQSGSYLWTCWPFLA